MNTVKFRNIIRQHRKQIIIQLVQETPGHGSFTLNICSHHHSSVQAGSDKRIQSVIGQERSVFTIYLEPDCLGSAADDYIRTETDSVFSIHCAGGLYLQYLLSVVSCGHTITLLFHAVYDLLSCKCLAFRNISAHL